MADVDSRCKNKYDSLQILRGGAAWMVVYHHYIQLLHGFGSENLGVIGQFFAQYGSFGVDLFFVLSGFVMYYSVNNYDVCAKEFLIKRLFRIAPAYWFYTLLLALLVYSHPSLFSYTSFNLKSLFSSLLFIPSINPSGIGLFPLLTVGWTLNFEMFFYVVLSLSIFIMKSRAVVFSALIIIFMASFWSVEWVYSRVLSDKIIYAFLAGLVVAYINSRCQIYKNLQLPLAMLLFVFSSAILIKFRLNVEIRILSASLFVFCFILLNDFLKKNIIVSFFIRLGDFSYSTYLLHIFVIAFLMWAIPFSVISDYELFVVFIFSVVVFNLSIYSFNFIENNKYVAHLKSRIIALF